MLRAQSVDGDDDIHVRLLAPLLGKRSKGAGHDLYVDAACEQQRNQLLDLSISNQGIAADQRQVQWFEPVHHLENSVDQVLPFTVVQFAKSHTSAEMCVVVRITARAA